MSPQEKGWIMMKKNEVADAIVVSATSVSVEDSSCLTIIFYLEKGKEKVVSHHARESCDDFRLHFS